ncbi:MAG: hypothetical protein AAFX94_08820, partial [Myxococcota bacterium]
MSNMLLIDEVERRAETGSIRLMNPAPGVVQTKIVGFAPMEFAHAATDFYTRVKEQHPDGLWALHDWSESTGYDPEARRKMIAWNRANRERVFRTEIFFKSRIVAMGVKVTALFIPMLRGITEAEDFEKSRLEAM